MFTSERGLGLPEVLIALLLSSVLLQGLLTLHWRHYHDRLQARQHSQLVLATRELLVRSRLHDPSAIALRQGLQRGGLPAAAAEAVCAIEACSAGQRADADLARFAYDLAGLPAALRWQLQPCAQAPADCLHIGWQGLDEACTAAAGLGCLQVSLP